MSSSQINRQIVLTETPQGKLSIDQFRLIEGAMPAPREGELLVKVRFLSVDPANRLYMKRATYRPKVDPGDVMGAFAVAEVVESKSPGFSRGDLVFCDAGWQDYAAMAAETAVKLPAIEPVSHLVSVYGISAGYTAYIGLLKFGRPAAGETVVVSGAAGAVGSVVGQIAKITGCRVVGIAGSDEKCAVLKQELGFDAAINYKAGRVADALKSAAPHGVDIYFDNVGGDTLRVCAAAMNRCGRIVICGAISGYDTGSEPVAGFSPPVVWNCSVAYFLVLNFLDEYARGVAELQRWVTEGRIKVYEDVIIGLENMPGALVGLLAGKNVGKRMVKVS
ncbi:MAG TPA: NADP-dependent oxidoreductase [Vicinamibacterales bacterium]